MNDVTTLVLGILLVAVSVPLILRRVPPNPFYGLRIPSVFADEWVWYEANAASGRDLSALGAVLVIGSFLPATTHTRVFVAIAGVFVVMVVGVVRANRLLDRRRNGR